MAFKQHKIHWTPETISRFWDFYQSHKTGYFSRLIGENILGELKKRKISLKGNVLDFGCGPGYLVKKMIDKKVFCYAFDSCESVIVGLNEKLKSNSYYKGGIASANLPTSYEDNFFDVIFFLETIEHIEQSQLETTLKELYRISKVGGIVIITTPNQEDLKASEIMCPECGSIFHPVQHIRSWCARDLTQEVLKNKFTVLICKPVMFKTRGNVFSIIVDLLTQILNFIRRSKPKLPHLLCIVQKKC